MFHSVTFKSDEYHRSIGGYDFSGYFIQFLKVPATGWRVVALSCREVFQQDGKISTVDGVNIQSSFGLYNRNFTIGLNLWKKKKGCLVKTALLS